MKYLILAAVLITTLNSTFAFGSAAYDGRATTSNGNLFSLAHPGKNVSEAQDREDAIKANLDNKSDDGEQKVETSEE